ncbi:hypothetical protein EBT31_00775 [bacterium]|jgi:hypothetical protein|nr:hypothetical protein [bacterium]
MAGTIVADQLEAASTSTLVIKNGVANTPPTIQDSAGTQIGTFCRAWVNFNGTGTVAIRASFNVSSITDQGVGRYRVNLTNAMPDTNYVTVGSVLNSTTPAVNAVAWLVGSDDSGATVGSFTTTSFQIGTFQSVATAWDPQYVQAAIFR